MSCTVDIFDINKSFFLSKHIDFVVFFPTETGLSKSIIDATAPVRSYFEQENFHFFNNQIQGEEGKVKKYAHLVFNETIESAFVSLYRPKTKKGDPRMWITGLRDYASSGDKIAVVVMNNELYLFNFSKINYSSISDGYLLASFFDKYDRVSSIVSEELLEKLKVISKATLRVQGYADTSIGRVIESALGIEINSSKTPDYKGIEIKSGRSKKKNRTSMFAQVADWSLSPKKSSEEILNCYGYCKGGVQRLYCTLSTKKRNSQGLYLVYDEKNDRIIEKDRDDNDVAVWPGDLLRARLLEKHAETFWISADSIQIGVEEHFHLKNVIHTKRPMVNQLLKLIDDGVVTMDHLIKRGMKSGRYAVSEKGPLFKIKKSDLGLLFPEPISYELP